MRETAVAAKAIELLVSTIVYLSKDEFWPKDNGVVAVELDQIL